MLFLTVAFLSLATPKEVDPPHGVFVGESWRYHGHSLLDLGKRTLADLVAIPSGVGGWSWLDVLAASLVTAVTVGFSIPLNPSVDVALQIALQRKLGRDHFRIWTLSGDTYIWLLTFGALFGVLSYGLVAANEPFVETAFLAIEAWLVTQFYVNFIKLWTGREGPRRNLGQGVFHGPEGFFKYYPEGTPSGHIASMWALFVVAMQYWEHPLLYALLGGVGVALSVALVMDDYHYTSEVIFGAAMGMAIGRWVVRHRSTRYRYAQAEEQSLLDRVTVAPAISPGSTYGIGIFFQL
jgi:membrane-associated phospholipid phosphatase